MSTSMATAASTAAAAATATPSVACTSNLYNIPVQDASCAISYASQDNATDIMSACCNDASVVSYYDDCGLYCLAQGQSVDDLTQCLYKNGAAYQDVFCRGNKTETASATGAGSVPTGAQASVIDGGSASKTGGSDSSKTGSGSGSTASSSEGAAPGVVRPDFGGKMGVVIGGLLFGAAAFGALL